MSTETPRTDRVVYLWRNGGSSLSLVEACRDLERELSRVTEEKDAAVDEAAKLQTENSDIKIKSIFTQVGFETAAKERDAALRRVEAWKEMARKLHGELDNALHEIRANLVSDPRHTYGWRLLDDYSELTRLDAAEKGEK